VNEDSILVAEVPRATTLRFHVQPMCGLRGKGSSCLKLLCESLSCGIIKYFDVMFLYICQSVTSPFSNPKLAMYIVDVVYGRDPSDVYCKCSIWLRAKVM
jgi:hypothetical protein